MKQKDYYIAQGQSSAAHVLKGGKPYSVVGMTKQQQYWFAAGICMSIRFKDMPEDRKRTIGIFMQLAKEQTA